MIANRPVICLTSDTNHKSYPEKREIQSPLPYNEAIFNAGGMPLIAPELCAEEMSELCDGLLLTGGSDVDTELYGEEKLNDTVSPDPLRTEYEVPLIKAFLDKGKPIMGICRGAQILNVVLGGTLYQDLVEQCGYIHSHGELRHYVYAEEGSVLYNIFGEKFKTNSFHHQAIKTLAPNLKVTARSIEGIIEAYEHTTLPIIATQFHPELLSGRYNNGLTPDFAPLFKHFVDTVKGR